eukprot:CAMPEP_0178972982 /NCGR_PEP_ID=MMETSP0789-20121207/21413_1 /TAXON_ID=3005 /ORGANISM="Rhizosolenia setigera, Strain CCMP 1694" /LENGTH=428 /DNA_ID=CAMNT_0020660685 /DNA_START=36 /DNA_END=1323 /DNA_ORIENTATION=-
MNESTIRLAPFPGSPKSDFLATVVPIQGINTKDDDEVGEDLPFEIILDQYTREPWSVSHTFSQQKWKQLHLKSIDGKGKLPGFLNYLKERKKAAFGTWILEDDHTRKGIFLVPFDQSSSPDGNNGTEREEDIIFCRYTLDDSIIRKKKAPPPSLVSAPPTAIQKKPTIPVASSSSLSTVSSTKKTKPNNNKNGKKKSSFMGNLLAAQERTDRHLAAVPKSAVSNDSKSSEDNLTNSSSTSSQTIIAKFRTDIEQKLLDFKNNLSQNVIEIPITLSQITSMLVGEEKLKVSMDVLKYIVYEQSEEIGEGLNWIAAKKSSEFFIDEAIICIYKDGHAPLDVLEDLNKGDLPDEIKQQQRAMREAAVKQMKNEDAQKLKKIQEHTLSRKNQASSKNDEPSKLNTKKRDRRTIAQIQDDMSKRQKYELDNYE